MSIESPTRHHSIKTDVQQSIRIAEIFGPTIQGEGPVIGQPSVFVRTGGCDYRCTWCDSMHAVDPKFRKSWAAMGTDEIWSEIESLSNQTPLLVSLSGGNPALQPFETLIQQGQSQGYSFAMETQGSVSKNWFALLDHLILSPKPPSSQMDTDWKALDLCLNAAGKKPQISLKIVVFDEADYQYAKDVSARYPHLPVYLQTGNDSPTSQEPDFDNLRNRTDWLVQRVLKDHWFEAKILPQLHVMLWGNEKGV